MDKKQVETAAGRTDERTDGRTQTDGRLDGWMVGCLKYTVRDDGNGKRRKNGGPLSE